MDDLNSQIAKLTADYNRQQELNTIRSKLVEDKKHTSYNNKIQELRGFNPLSVQPHPQENLLKRVVAPENNSLSTRNTRFENDNHPQSFTQDKLSAMQNDYQSRMPALRHNQHSPLLQQHQQSIQAGNFDTYATMATPAKQYKNSQPAAYTREDMNAKMDMFRFDNTTFQRGSLVPVNMDHYYSGNLFAEGNPVPEDLRNEYTPGLRAHPNGRVHYQEKSKTIYKDEFNERLSALSPLSRTLFFPVGGQEQQQPQTQQLGTLTNVNNRRQEISHRMSEHAPLSSPMALPGENTGGQPKKVAYNSIYPVSSK